MRLRPRRVGPVVVTALAVLVAASCGDDADSTDGGSASSEILLVQQPWEDLVVENEIVRQLLGDLGYDVSVNELGVPVGAQGLSDGDADVYLGNWWPSQQPVFQEYLDDGSIQVVKTLVTGTAYAPAVPKYVAEEHGIESLADLAPNADLFGSRFVGIAAGTPGNEYIADAIAEDAYGLGDWTLAQSSTPAMLAEVETAAAAGEPIVFLGWEPHWMNVEWDLVYLDDPDEVWPGAGEIRILTNAEYHENNPNVVKFLEQMSVDLATASEWIHQLSQEDLPAEEIASTWIEENPNTVEQWLDGVEPIE